MNTCMIIASTVWLHFNDGYVMQYVNVNTIANITVEGYIHTNERSGSRYTIWDEQRNQYLNGDDVMDMIRNCEVQS